MAAAALLALWLVAPLWALAQAVRVSAEVGGGVVYLGESARLGITVEGADDVAPPTIPPIDGVTVSYLGPTVSTVQSTSIVNGRRVVQNQMTTTFQYALTPSREGQIVVPPVRVDVGGQVYTTQEIRLHARVPGKSEYVRLRASVDNRTPFVGQPVRLRLTVYLARQASAPVFDVPGVADRFDVYSSDRRDPRAGETWLEVLGRPGLAVRGSGTIDGVDYTTFTVERVLVPRVAGEVTIGPISMSCQLDERVSRSFFERSSSRPVRAEAEAITLNVRPLPQEGRPAGFSGLVGPVSITAEASATEANVGDPITLTVAVAIAEPLERVPDLLASDRGVLGDAFRLAGESAPAQRGNGRVVFRQSIRPTSGDVREIPSIELAYFDPSSGTYQVARSGAIPLQIRATRVVTAGDAVGSTPMGPVGLAVEDRAGGLAANIVDPRVLRDDGFELRSAVMSPGVAAALVLPPVGYVAAAVMAMARRRSPDQEAQRRRRRAAETAQASLARLPAGDATAMATAVSLAVRQFLADRVPGVTASAAAITPETAGEALARVDAGLAERVRGLLAACDGVRFAGAAAGEPERLAAEARSLVTDVDARVRGVS